MDNDSHNQLHDARNQLHNARNAITIAQGYIFQVVKKDTSVCDNDLVAMDAISNELEEVKRKIAILVNTIKPRKISMFMGLDGYCDWCWDHDNLKCHPVVRFKNDEKQHHCIFVEGFWKLNYTCY